MSSSVPAAADPPGSSRPTSVRYAVLVLLALAATAAYLTRICLSVANTTIQQEFGISNARMGEVLSAFYLGYLWFQVPTGWLGARFGGRATMAGLYVLASLAGVWGGFAPGALALQWSRIGLGAAQAGLVPCSSRAVVDWFPTTRRGAASSLITACMSVGAVLATWLTARLLPALGWRGVLFAYSAVGIAWAAVYFLVFRDRPELHRAVNAGERALIRGVAVAEAADLTAVPPKPPDPTLAERRRRTMRLLGAMATSSSAWLICWQAFFRAFGAAFLTTWFPAFLQKGHGVKLADTGNLASLPLAASVLGALVGGNVVDWLLRKTGSRRVSRSGTSAVAMGLCAACTLAASAAHDPFTLVLTLALGSFCFAIGSPASWAAAMDISGSHTQVVFAVQNMAGNVGAMFCPMVVGQLFDHIEKTHAPWNQVLYLFAGIHLAGALCWLFLNPNRSAVGAEE